MAAIHELEGLLETFIPHISQPTLYGYRRNGKPMKHITMETIIAARDPYPWMVLPTTQDGIFAHVFWAINDIIFDTSTKKAMKWILDMIQYIFGTLDLNVQARHYCNPTKYTALKQQHPPFVPQYREHYHPTSLENWQTPKIFTNPHQDSQRKKKRRKKNNKGQERR